MLSAGRKHLFIERVKWRIVAFSIFGDLGLSEKKAKMGLPWNYEQAPLALWLNNEIEAEWLLVFLELIFVS